MPRGWAAKGKLALALVPCLCCCSLGGQEILELVWKLLLPRGSGPPGRLIAVLPLPVPGWGGASPHLLLLAPFVEGLVSCCCSSCCTLLPLKLLLPRLLPAGKGGLRSTGPAPLLELLVLVLQPVLTGATWHGPDGRGCLPARWRGLLAPSLLRAGCVLLLLLFFVLLLLLLLLFVLLLLLQLLLV